jgi:hypothetical protein
MFTLARAIHQKKAASSTLTAFGKFASFREVQL